MQRRSAALLLVAALALAPPALAAGYSIDPIATTETPTRTVDLEGTEFEISAFGRVPHGESTSVDVSAPASEYDVYLYDTDRETVWGPTNDDYLGPFSGDANVPLPTDRLSPGTYVVAVATGDQFRAIHPLVVQGYDIDLDAPASLEAEASGELSVSLSRTGAKSDPASVDVALANESWDRTIETEKQGGSYEATFSVASPGEYYVYAAARGTETAYGGRAEALAITASEPLSVTEPTTTTTTTTTSSGGSSGGGLPPSTDEPTTTAEPSTTAEPTTDSTTAAAETTTDVATTTAAPTTTDSVITPNAGGNESTTTTESGGTPGFSVGVTLVALALTALAALRGDRF